MLNNYNNDEVQEGIILVQVFPCALFSRKESIERDK